MKNYMVLVQDDDGVVSAKFFNSFECARNYAMDAECGMAYYVELYQRSEERGYELIY